MPPYLTLPVEKGGRGPKHDEHPLLCWVYAESGGHVFPAIFVMAGSRTSWDASDLLILLHASAQLGINSVVCSGRARPWIILVLGALVGFLWAQDFFAGSGIIGSELFPTRVRARASGIYLQRSARH